MMFYWYTKFLLVLFASFNAGSPLNEDLDKATTIDEADDWQSEACICSPTDEPLCASDGQTYRNPCTYRCRNDYVGHRLEILKFERCEGEVPTGISIPLHKDSVVAVPTIKNSLADDSWKEDCSCVSFNYPICASDGKTYDSPCLFNCRNKQVSNELKIVKFDRCKEFLNELLPLETVTPDEASNEVDYRKDKKRSISDNLQSQNCQCPVAVTGESVCASDGKTYESLCVFLCQNKERSDSLSNIKHDKCKVLSKLLEPPPIPSNDDWQSIIITSSTASSTIATAGRDSSSTEQTLDDWNPDACLCTTRDEPLCASDNRMYKNLCEFKCRNKYLGYKLLITNYGKCKNRDTVSIYLFSAPSC